MNDFNLKDLSGATTGRAEWYRRIPAIMAGKFGTSFMASVTVAVLWKLASFKSLLVWTCQLVLILFGREEPPEPIKQKLEIVAVKAMEVAGPGEDAPLPLASIREKLTAPVAEASEEVKENAVLSVQESMKATVQEKIAAPVVEVAEQAKEKAEQATTVVKEEVAEVREHGQGGGGKGSWQAGRAWWRQQWPWLLRVRRRPAATQPAAAGLLRGLQGVHGRTGDGGSGKAGRRCREAKIRALRDPEGH